MNRLLILMVVLLSACAPSEQAPAVLTVMTHDSFSVSETVVRGYENANQVSVSFLKSGDAGAALNKAILARNAPLADVLFGVDNTFITRALDAGIFEPYASPALASIPLEFQLDPEHRALPVDYGDVCRVLVVKGISDLRLTSIELLNFWSSCQLATDHGREQSHKPGPLSQFSQSLPAIVHATP